MWVLGRLAVVLRVAAEDHSAHEKQITEEDLQVRYCQNNREKIIIIIIMILKNR